MTCYLCKSTRARLIHKGTRDRPDIDVMRCLDCSLVFLSGTNHVTKGLYESDGQAKSTADIEVNAYNFDTEKRITDYSNVFAGKSILDFGCGQGHFIKKIKDLGIAKKIYALEPNLIYQEHLKKHFNYVPSISDIEDESLDYITLFHVMEHIPAPIDTLNSIFSKLKAGGRVIIEVPHSEDALLKLYESNAFADFTYWSLHLYLFNQKTLETLASRTQFKLSYIRYYQRYGLANHLHWLARGRPGGQNKWFFLNDENLDSLYGSKLAELGLTDTIVMALEK